MTIYSDACGRVIDITLEYQTKPLLEMQEKLAESEEENTEEESKKSAQAEASQIPVEIESQQTTFRVSFSLVV
ncbi:MULTISPECIES: hypothetical protein [Helicobacter]|uniref:Uncharacterized protein n=1 Tax=Helicobacter ganmani TaxID=60246 RepID=A0A3D8IE33_9HELI|nr:MULTISPECIES: hypothetical protein [Helicobacter]RDU63360.1 hypothetical protein CQA43_04340 [Helicobacter ganmani]